MTIGELYDLWLDPHFNARYFYLHEGKNRRVYGIKPVYDWCFEIILAGLEIPILVNDDEIVEKGGKYDGYTTFFC